MLTCPNKSSKEWQELTATLGEEFAMAAFKLYNDDIPSVEVATKLLVSNNILPALQLGNSTEHTAMANLVNKLNNAHAGMNVTFVNSDEIPGSYIVGNQVVINLTKATPTTVLHEFAHLPVEWLASNDPKAFNKLYKELIETAEGRELWDELHTLYSGEQLRKEIITEAVAREANSRLKDPMLLDLIRSFLLKFIGAVNKVMGTNFKAHRVQLNKLVERTTKGSSRTQRSAVVQFSKNPYQEKLSVDAVTLDEAANVYKDAAGNQYERANTVIGKHFASSDGYDIDKQIEKRAEKLAKGGDTINIEQFDPTTRKTTMTSIPKSDWIAKAKEAASQGKDYGNYIHYKIESIVNKVSRKTEIDKIVAALWEEGEPNHLTTEAFEDMLEDVVGALSKARAEVKVYNNELGWAGSIDLVQFRDSPNENLVSIFDFKTGKDVDVDVTHILKYSALVGGVKDTSMERYNLTQIMYVFMLKTMHPELVFDEIALVRLYKDKNKHSDSPLRYSKSNIGLTKYLSMIDEYIKQTNPKLHREYKAKGFFNPASYRPKLKQTQDLSYERSMVRYAFNKDGSVAAGEVDMFGKPLQGTNTAEFLYHLRKFGISKGFDTEGISSDKFALNALDRYFMSVVNAKHPLLKAFASLRQEGYERANSQFAKKKKIHDQLLMNLRKHKGHTGVGRLKTVDYKKFYDFMFEDRGSDGVWLRKDYTGLSKAEADYLKFIKDTFLFERESTMDGLALMKHYEAILAGETVGTYELLEDHPEGGTYADVLRNRIEYIKSTPYLDKWSVEARDDDRVGMDDTWMPRMMKRVDEQGHVAGSLKYWFMEAFNKSIMTEEGIIGNKTDAVPIKYLGNLDMIQDRDHSFNMENMFNMFVNNMTEKRNLDSVIAFGKGIKLHMQMAHNRSTDVGGASYENTIKYVEDLVNLLAGRTSTYRVPLTGLTVDVVKVGYTLRSWTSWIMLGFSPLKAVVLAVPNFLLSIMRAAQGSIMSATGSDVGEYRFTMKQLGAAWRDYLAIQAQLFMYGKDFAKWNKKYLSVYQLLKKYNLDLYKDTPTRMKQQVKKFNAWRSNWSFVVNHSLESSVTTTTAIAQIRAAGMIDKFDENGNYIGPVRGLDPQTGLPVTDFTANEIMAIKRRSDLIFGEYRKEAKLPVELTPLGSLFMQFFKWFPNTFHRAFVSRYRSISLGKYVKVYDEQGNVKQEQVMGPNGAPELVDLMQWEESRDRGWVVSVYKLMLPLFLYWNAKKRQQFKAEWESMSETEKAKLYQMVAAGIAMFMFYILATSSYDEDEPYADQGFWWKVYNRLSLELLPEVYPSTYLDKAANPFPAFDIADKIYEGFKQLFTEGDFSKLERFSPIGKDDMEYLFGDN